MTNLHKNSKNYTWAKCPSKKFNTMGAYSGEEREGSNEIREIICHLIDDDKYDNNVSSFDSST
tara:strand:+ start:2168 stop:2356 length:189 start_codon:yes stop_codon:yes gene_type:complete